MQWKVTYYNEQVTDIIRKWPKKLLAKYLRILDLIEEEGPNLGEPFTKKLDKGLYEIRVKAQEGIGRALYCYVLDKEIIILTAFIKKTQKTPPRVLKLAKERMKEVKS